MFNLWKEKKQDGFTLVELMVVVAIIGLLSAVAVPNFKKYQAKAKISEAKLQLAALYTAEAAFFSDFNMYATCLRYMGFDPALEAPNRYYAVGFGHAAVAINANAHAAAVNSGLNAAGCPASLGPVNGTGNLTLAVSYFTAGKGIGGSIATDAMTGVTTTLGNQATAAAMTFTAGAVGFISADNLATAAGADQRSVLTMNQNKVLSTIANGY